MRSLRVVLIGKGVRGIGFLLRVSGSLGGFWFVTRRVTSLIRPGNLKNFLLSIIYCLLSIMYVSIVDNRYPLFACR